MKKKQMLATLVMLSLLQGSVYAANYNDQSNVTGENIQFDQMLVDNGSPANITIGNEDTKTITIGSDGISRYNPALQINDAFTVGTSAHKVTLNAEQIDIKAGDGLGISIGSSYEKNGYSSLTVKGKTFNYAGNGYGGITVTHGSLIAGDETNWLDEFNIIGGNLSVGVQPAYDVGSYIYAHKVNIENNANGKGNAFDGDGYSNINADSISLKGSFETGSASTGASGVLSFGSGSNNNFKADTITIEAEKTDGKSNEYLYAIKSNSGSKDEAYTLNLNAGLLLDIKGNVLLDAKGTATFTGNTIKITGDMQGITGYGSNSERSGITVNNASNLVIGTEEDETNNVIVAAQGGYGVLLGGPTDGQNTSEKGTLQANVQESFSVTAENGIGMAALRDTSYADITAGSFIIKAGKDGLQADIGSLAVSAAGMDGIFIDAGERGIYTNGSTTQNAEAFGGHVDLTAQNGNVAVSANGSAIEALTNSSVKLTSENNNIILTSQNTDADRAAVYAEGNRAYNGLVAYKPTVDLTAENGTVCVTTNGTGVWASGKGSTININGALNINSNYTGGDTGISLMSEDERHVAISAGGMNYLDSFAYKSYGKVNVNLKGSQNSQIIGDIVGARDGVVNVNSADYSGSLTVFGDILAGNGGTRQDSDGNKINVGAVNFDLGKSGYFAGRVDDYQDADLKDDLEFFDPHFTDGKVTQAGTVNLKMGSGSKWQVTGQSWVTTLEGNDSTIILNGEESGGYAVHIGKLTGSNTFVVNLNPDKSEFAEGDMIYVQDGTESKLQTLKVANEEELLKNKDWDRIRFATVANAAGSAGDSNFEYGGSFGDTYTIKGRGIRNVDYAIEYVAMNEDTTSAEDNLAYNGGSEDLTAEKPGTEYNEETYNKTDEGQNSQYVYLTRSNGTDDGTGDYTDSAKSIINMSRANYKNAIYMDRLNKRLGEARYINGEEEQGMWVRIRHDRIGMDGEFRSQNTMYEMGYDEKQDCDNGERRVGFAIDYMDGSTTYSDIMGKGETKRYGLWLYDTWLGDKGHYADYVAKWGHLSNDFDIHDKDSLDHVVGDYSNNVFSVSAEYGKKNDMGNNWYFEPQAQLQLARVTGAEYTTTTQDTNVKVDGINSLIGRAGFRLGRDLNENSTVYIKADLLHEFLGDQTITATDATGTLRETIENKGTWYDVGFGFATALGKNSYAFMDFEKSFGNDNDETYQINAGMQWTF